MQRSIEVVALLRGEAIATHRLSPARRWRLTLAATLPFMAASAAVCGALALVGRSHGGTIYAPSYLVACAALAAASAMLARRAWRAAGRFRIGPGLSAQAFSRNPADLVRLTATGAELRIDPDMSGTLGSASAEIPLESITQGKTVRLALAVAEKAVVSCEPMTFVVRWVGEPDARQALPWGRMVRPALAGAVLGALPALFVPHPVGAAVPITTSRRPTLFRIVNGQPVTIDRAEADVRALAQFQAEDLADCFEPLPAECQEPASLSIGLALTTEGEVRRAWVARLSLPARCALDECTRRVAGRWRFDELPRPRTFVLPLQVAGAPLASLTSPWPADRR